MSSHCCRARPIAKVFGAAVLVSGFVEPSVARADEGITVTDLGVVNSRAAALDTDETGVRRGDTQECLGGQTVDGHRFSGCDAIAPR